MPSASPVPAIPLSYDKDDSEGSARRILYDLYAEWKGDGVDLKFKTFTQGITNTMLKIDHAQTSVVLRAFGPGAEPLTSRPREVVTHGLFAEYGLASPLLARFENGLIYQFGAGEPCDTDTLSEERVWKGVARTLGHWHSILPIGAEGSQLALGEEVGNVPERGEGGGAKAGEEVVEEVKTTEAPGDMWAVLRSWCERIPEREEEERKIKERMKEEVEYAFETLGGREGLGGQKLVMGHCDLLSGNIVVRNPTDQEQTAEIQFIDYEYSVACHAAFDMSLHFGEWSGFKCDYTKVPTPSIREKFMDEYVDSWRQSRAKAGKQETSSRQDDVKHMCELVDDFRGLPGLWFALWALVQAHDSSEEFDYRKYARLRAAEYFSWKGIDSPLGVGKGDSDPEVREDIWFGRTTKSKAHGR